MQADAEERRLWCAAASWGTQHLLRVKAGYECVCVGQAAEWAEAARERGEGVDMRGRPEVEMVEAFSEHERHLEAALAAARAPGATPEVRKNAPAYLGIGRMVLLMVA